jgi:uncharacterized membrane-anchored protein
MASSDAIRGGGFGDRPRGVADGCRGQALGDQRKSRRFQGITSYNPLHKNRRKSLEELRASSPGFSFAEEMRAVILALLGEVILAAASAQAASLLRAASAPELGTAPPAELVAQDCGHGWHRHHWHDHLAHWHWGQCVPYVGGRTRSEHPYENWRGPTGGFGNP